jgi:hypothetical protein
MALDNLNVTKNIPSDQKLWRYMKPDRLIQILENQQLYFTSLTKYESSDPFEGIFPKTVLYKLGEIIQTIKKSRSESSELIEKYIFQKYPSMPMNLQEEIREKVAQINNMYEPMEDLVFKIIKSSVVNCWHQNDFESEAMWRLYANKGVAIQTTVENLVHSIDDQRVFFSEVKYIDFDDQNLTISDCLHQKGLNPLLKRLQFKHEQEARLYFCPTRNYLDKHLKEQGECIAVDTARLISKIYISPYLAESTANKLRRKIKKLGIKDEDIISSRLLKIDENLRSLY